MGAPMTQISFKLIKTDRIYQLLKKSYLDNTPSYMFKIQMFAKISLP